MVIGICGPLVSRKRILLEVRKEQRDGFLELRIVTLAHCLGIELDFDVGRDALVFDFPLVVGRPESATGSGDDATVHERLERAEESNEAAPGALPDKSANFRLAEMPRHSVAA